MQMKRILLALAALVLASCGVLTGPVEAHASAVPEYASCIKTKLNKHTNRYWFDPGNLTPNIRSVQVGGVNMDRRRDGIWVADASVVGRKGDPYIYFTYNFSKHKGAWVPCRKPKPRVIR